MEYLFGFVTADGEEAGVHGDLGPRPRRGEASAGGLHRLRHRAPQGVPDLHIYHYNHYEVTALKRIAGAHGTREEELDQLLRDEVFVDLYRVVREAL